MFTDRMSKTILLVEDESSVAGVITKILNRSGYKVITADSGIAAVDIALKNNDINLILMDIDLGDGIDGTETARRILNKIDLPIVFHTSHAEQEMVEKVRGITSYGYVIKSSESFVLISSIEMALQLFESYKKVDKSEKLFRGLFYNSLNAIALVELIYNEQGRLIDGRLIALNPVFERSVGFRAEDVVGKLYSYIHPDVLKDGKIQKLEELLNKGEPYISEAFYEPLQKYFNFTAYEIDKGLVAIIMEDITGQTLAKRTLIENEIKLKSLEMLNRITDSIPACVACVNAKCLKYVFVNRIYQETFSISKEEMIGMHVRDIIGDAAFNNAFSYIERARKGEQISYENMIPSHGELRCFNVNYIPQFDENGMVEYLIVLSVDITERTISEKRISTLLNEKEILLKEVHHRIKNNMSAIASILFLQSDFVKEQSAIAALKDAESRVHSMMLLYDKLYRSDNVGELAIMDYLPPLADEIMRSFPGSRRIKVLKEITDFSVDVKFLFPLGIIINELITNIMKYAFNSRDSGLITITAYKNDEYATISIEDDGVGLPEHIDIKNSSGFGLYLVGVLTEQIEGKIRIERINGTRFVLEFRIS